MYIIKLSVSKTNKYRQHLECKKGRTRHCQMIRDINKVKRNGLCDEKIRNDKKFEDVHVHVVKNRDMLKQVEKALSKIVIQPIPSTLMHFLCGQVFLWEGQLI